MSAKIKKTPKRSGYHRPTRPKGVSPKAFRKVYWPYIPIILIIGVLLSLGTSAGALSAFARNPKGNVLAYATSMSVSGLLDNTNSARSQNGSSKLKLNAKLNAAAQTKANDMAARNYWSHNTPDGDPPWVFVTAKKYLYQKLGENLAAGFSDEQSSINGWMASPPHRQNLLDPAFTEVGFGFANNSDYTAGGGGPMTIVVAFYGKPQVLSASTTSPSPAPTSPKPVSAKTATSDAKSPVKKTPAVQKPLPVPPATTDTAASAQLANKASHAQVALADLPLARFGTLLAVIAVFIAVALWISRHALAIRRALVYGESFAVRHPLTDIGLLIIAALSFLLSQTAGFIQ